MSAAPQAGRGIRTKTPRPAVKFILKSPYRLQWPAVNEAHNKTILSELKSGLSLHLSPRNTRPSKKHAPVESVPPSIQRPTKDYCVMGINAVTRALEKNDLRLVLVCRSACNVGLVDHLIPQCVASGTPACAVNGLSDAVSSVLNVRSIMAIGFKVDPDEDVFDDMISILKDKAPDLQVPWATVPRKRPSVETSSKECVVSSDTTETMPSHQETTQQNGTSSMPAVNASAAMRADSTTRGDTTATQNDNDSPAVTLLEMNVSRKVFLPKPKKQKLKK